MVKKADNERYTSIGHSLFHWKPIRPVSCAARWLWLACYAGDGTKRSVPGLFPGSMHGMAEAAEITYNETFNALDELIVHKLVVFDAENRLLRYLQLPDAHDRAHTFQAISGWFTRFRSLPACPQRDAHVPLLKWMVEQGEVNERMSQMWKTTFGTIAIPTDLPRYGSIALSDTGTAVQPSLFGPPPTPPNKIKTINPSPHPSPLGLDQDPDQDQVSDLGEEEGEDPPAGPLVPSGAIGSPIKRHLQLVPDPPADQPALDAPPERTTALATDPTAEERAQTDREQYAAEMRRAHQEAARALGDPVLMS